MHYKDGTPAKLGDIVLNDSGAVGIVIGGTIGSDYCSTQVVKFNPVPKPNQYAPSGPGFIGFLSDPSDPSGKVVTAAVSVSLDTAMQTRECLKIGHVDIGHG